MKQPIKLDAADLSLKIDAEKPILVVNAQNGTGYDGPRRYELFLRAANTSEACCRDRVKAISATVILSSLRASADSMSSEGDV